MPQSLANIWLHTVFSTQNRQKVFLKEHMRDSMCSYMTGVLRDMGCWVARINLTTDHIHILHQLSRTSTIADVVATIKRRTTDWLAEQEWTRGNADFHQFHWQKGYGVFSVSESATEDVKEYIDKQIEHHKRVTFQDEYRALLRKHSIEFDERYVWD